MPPVARGDEGVSDSEIRIAIGLVNLVGPAGNAAFGVPPPDEQRADYDLVIQSVSGPAPTPADSSDGAPEAFPAGGAAPTSRPTSVEAPVPGPAPSSSVESAAVVRSFSAAVGTTASLSSLPAAEPLAVALVIGATLVAAICWSRGARPVRTGPSEA